MDKKIIERIEEMVAIDKGDDPVFNVLHNITKFSALEYKQWLEKLTPRQKAVASNVRPDRVYELDNDVLGVVVGFSGRGQVVLRKVDGIECFLVDSNLLVDVTEKLKRKYGML